MKLSATLAGLALALVVASGASAHRVVPVLSEVRPDLGGARGWGRASGAVSGGPGSAGSFRLLPSSAGAGLEALARLNEAERAEVLARRRLGLFHGGVGHSELFLPLGGEGEILAIVDAPEGLVLVAGSPVDPASLGGSSLVVRRAAQVMPGTLSLYGGGGGAGDVQGYEGRLLVWRPDDPGAYLPAEYSIEANLALADPAGHPIHGPPSGLTYLHTGQGDVVWSAPTDTPILTASAVGNDRYFHARPWIDSIALYDYRARFYDPATSTFLELDPLGPVDSPNLYQAFGFDGLDVRDPWGLRDDWAYAQGGPKDPAERTRRDEAARQEERKRALEQWRAENREALQYALEQGAHTYDEIRDKVADYFHANGYPRGIRANERMGQFLPKPETLSEVHRNYVERFAEAGKFGDALEKVAVAEAWLSLQALGAIAAAEAEVVQASASALRTSGDLIQFRREIALAFYRESGFTESQIAQHLRGIDFSQPVEIVTLPKGTRLIQYQIPGNPIGNYFAPPGTTGDTLGFYTSGREVAEYVTTTEVRALKSVAKSTVDDWSMRAYGWKIEVEGGGTQYFTTSRDIVRIHE